MKPDSKKIKALGKLESFRKEIQDVQSLLQRTSFWKPGAALQKECEAVLHLINNLEEQFDRKLITTILGPGGSGKSTLFNALVGKDNISKVGTGRPTTQQIVLQCSTQEEREFFESHFGTEKIQVLETPHAPHLENIILIDTPDVDSSRMANHTGVVRKAIETSDILLCVFNAENPKTKDHVDFFAPYVRLFHGESLIGLLNKSDRLDEKELKEVILPQFESYIESAWDRPLQSLLCISARRHSENPEWDIKAPPKHDFDQFDDLMKLAQQTFNRPGYAVDRRLDNAKQLRDFILSEFEEEVNKDRDSLVEAGVLMKNSESTAFSNAVSQMKETGTGQVLGINVLLYQKIAQKWVGPVGWMIAIWARVLIFGTGVMAVFRFGNPIRQILGTVSSLRHFKDAKAAISETESGEPVGSAFRTYRVDMLKNWPEISEHLIQGRFDQEIRNSERFIVETKELNMLASMWRETLDATIDTTSRKFSHILLQIIFNLPTVALLVHVAWLTAQHYLMADYLSSDFFLHAFLTIAIVLLLSFFLFQAIIRVGAGSDRLMEKAFTSIKTQLDPSRQILFHPLFDQVDKLLGFTPVKLH